MEAVKAAALNPATAFSWKEALTTNFAAGLDTTAADLDDLRGRGLRKPSAEGRVLWAARGSGSAIDTAEVEAIIKFLVSWSLSGSVVQ
ncbi:hypothetical protein D3Z60_27635, partial [Lachnospiraceae bacterium]|nr:hypothetical protein [Lachnospiraceae bacterium]